MRYDIFLLDADGTLLDFSRCEDVSLRQALRRGGIPCGDEVAALYSRINRSLWEAFERGEMPKAAIHCRRFEMLLAELGISGDAAAIADDYRDGLACGYFLIDGALQVCRTLARMGRIYIVTNGVSRTQFSRLAGSGLMDSFRGIFVSEDAGSPKPSRAYFDYVFARIPGFDRNRAILVGDSLTSDMAGGETAGVDTAWYNPEALPLPHAPRITYDLRSLDQLPELVRTGKLPIIR